ncbi:MAG TPA: peptidoglycan DD-metalloendopeptidase family protein [Longimicrobiales bacterium]|nr:peptidoglycan DD-metalloendopeptidase family protein [Longimicrobiales bacterium]
MRRPQRWMLIPALVVLACSDDSTTGPGPDSIVGISVLAPSDVIVVRRSIQLEVQARTASGDRAALPGAAWTTSDPEVADVTAAGVVTGVAEGAAFIRATAGGHEAVLTVRVAPDSLPIFTAAPFEGSYFLWNPFDHDVPIWSGVSGSILIWQGFNVSGLEGHNGYDWAMPEGTPIFAVGDGVVAAAGGEPPWSCPLLNDQTVSALRVVIIHTAPSGERFMSIYIHLARLDVEPLDSVVAGQQIGLSGNTGCSTGPHLHFEVRREFYHRAPPPAMALVTDPNGWAGTQQDPWLLHGRGGASTYLWAAGASPSFPLTSAQPGPPAVAGPPVPFVHLHRFSIPPLPPRPDPDDGR